MKRTVFAMVAAMFALFGGNSCSGGDGGFEAKVRESVARQMADYPASTLKDLYKSFFQDRFGPGHIVADTVAARRYLAAELDSYELPETSGSLVEPTGWQHNYVRIDLDAVKRGLIPPETLLDAFVRSANEAEAVTLDEWRTEWARIELIISDMNLSLPDYDADLQEIETRLGEGRYMGHHSRAYNDAFHPHYRIVSRAIYENEVRPLFEPAE